MERFDVRWWNVVAWDAQVVRTDDAEAVAFDQALPELGRRVVQPRATRSTDKRR
jgi:hypothetical protein